MNATIETPETKAVSQIRGRAVLFLVLAIATGSAAIWLLTRYVAGVRGSAGGGLTVPVVVAAMDVPIAVRLEPKHVQVVQWPKAFAPAGSFSSLKRVLDHTVRTSMVKGEPILDERLADEKDGRGLAALLAEGMRAMAVTVDAAVGVAGFVQPGDYVDVITTMQPDDETKKAMAQDSAKIAKIILQNVLVLAVGEHLSAEDGDKPLQVKVVTLGVQPDESEKLALASQHGKITLTMRSRTDQKLAATQGATPFSLLKPDDGSVQAAPRLIEPAAPRTTLRPAAHRRPVPAAAPTAPLPPVVEILRGSKVEERKLRVPEASEATQ